MSAARDMPELGDLLAARAAGENAPHSARELEIALERSPAARAELAELANVVAHARAALPAADPARRARLDTAIATAHARARRRWRFASAAALLALLAAFLVWRTQRGAPPPTSERGMQRLALGDLLGELHGELAPHGGTPWTAEELAEPVSPRMGGGSSARPERRWLAPVAAQVDFAPLRAEKLPPDTHLARASVLRASASGPPSDAFWLRYDSPSGGIALLQCAARPEARAWLESVSWPAGWSARIDERAGVLVATACASCDAQALAALAAALEPIAR